MRAPVPPPLPPGVSTAASAPAPTATPFRNSRRPTARFFPLGMFSPLLCSDPNFPEATMFGPRMESSAGAPVKPKADPTAFIDARKLLMSMTFARRRRS